MAAMWNFVGQSAIVLLCGMALFFGVRRVTQRRIVGPYNLLENAQERLTAQLGAFEGMFEMSWHDAIGGDHTAKLDVRDGSRAFAVSHEKRLASFTIVLGTRPFHLELPLKKRPPGGVHFLMIFWNEALDNAVLVVDGTELWATPEGIVERPVPRVKR